MCGVGGRWLANAVGGSWPRRTGRRIVRRRGVGELVVDWSRLKSVAERIGGWVGIIELRLGLAGGGWWEMKSSGCLLRLAVGIERRSRMRHWVRGHSGVRALSQECRTWCESA